MTVVLAVLDDLWQFAYTVVFGVRTVTQADELEISQPTLPLSAPSVVTNESNLLAGREYFVRAANTPLMTDPSSSAAPLVTLSYGQSVLVRKTGEQWVQVLAAGYDGWLPRSVLAERADDVFPRLQINKTYQADNLETKKLRTYVATVVPHTVATNGALTSVEYIYYRLKRARHKLAFGEVRPGLAGTWQRVLRGQSGVHIGVHPRAEVVMEYVVDEVGHLAYVETVFPDESIKVSEIGLATPGQYSERMLTQAEYRELRPVFIAIA